MGSSARRNGNAFYILDRRNFILWNLNLDLISNPRSRLGPIIWRHETARRSRSHERAANACSCDPELAGPLPVHLDGQAWIIQRLIVLKITQTANLAYLGADLFTKRPVCRKIRTTHIDLHRAGSAEVHDLGDDISRLE